MYKMSTTEMFGPYGNRIQEQINRNREQAIQKAQTLQAYKNEVARKQAIAAASAGTEPNRRFKNLFKSRGLTRGVRVSRRKQRKTRKQTRTV